MQKVKREALIAAKKAANAAQAALEMTGEWIAYQDAKEALEESLAWDAAKATREHLEESEVVFAGHNDSVRYCESCGAPLREAEGGGEDVVTCYDRSTCFRAMMGAAP